ncbi:MAG: zinc metallopeptidase, partial [Chthonomonas sp.]|nr:zinc metallopeptidase [Chthonomonas sp.]
MRWKGREQSDNVEDRRGLSPGMAVGGGGVGVLIIAVVVMLLGGDPSALLQGASQGQSSQTRTSSEPYKDTNPERTEFVKVVLKDTEDVWTKIFAERGATYEKPKLILFTDGIQSACGFASAAVGPFYCPGDRQVYIDLAFYDDLKQKFGAPGDFAQAYVIAHEVGHHVQNLLGISDKVNEMRSRMSDPEFNKVSVRMELQADFFAGVWARHDQDMKNILDREDIEDALNAANAIGDDTLQKRMQGQVVPDSFTH